MKRNFLKNSPTRVHFLEKIRQVSAEVAIEKYFRKFQQK